MQKTAKKKGFFVSIMDYILTFVKMDLIERRNLAGYIFVIPFIIGLLLVFIPALWQTFIFSINDIVIRSDGTGYDLAWYGFGYYKEAFTVDVMFRQYLLETLRDMCINLPVIMIFSFFMAIMLNKKKLPGRTLFRVIFFMPVIIMLIIPVAFSGALFALPLTGRELSMISLVSLIMLAGTVVNNSIILVDYINVRRARGERRQEAILNACPRRIRPVMMTTITTVLAMVPLAFGIGDANEMMSDMGVTMMSGMIVSTLVTLVFTPVYYSVIDSIGAKFQRKKPL